MANELKVMSNGQIVPFLDAADIGNDGDVLTRVGATGAEFKTPSGGGVGAWGDITGTLSAQTDLQSALDGKADVSTASRWLTKTVNWLRFQALDFNGTPDEGAFTLTYDGVACASIPFGFDEADIQTALNGIAALTGHVTVVVNPLSTDMYIVIIDLDDPELLAEGANTLEASNVPVAITTGVIPNCDNLSVPFVDITAGAKVEDVWVERLAYTGTALGGDLSFADEAASSAGNSTPPSAPAYWSDLISRVYPVGDTYTNVAGNDSGSDDKAVSFRDSSVLRSRYSWFPVIAKSSLTLHLWLNNPAGGGDVTGNKQRYHILCSSGVEVAE